MLLDSSRGAIGFVVETRSPEDGWGAEIVRQGDQQSLWGVGDGTTHHCHIAIGG